MKYDFKAIEKKWQNEWDEKQAFKTENDFTKKKFYGLNEFPYPSGAGLHVGHPRPYTALDIISRKRRMQGYNVLFPMGWDAFGLPTENYAIEHKLHPADVTRTNVARFREQIKALGLSYDWSREIDTTDPSYYKWTQWIFLRLFKKGLAYKKEMNVNWCTHCKVVLANEEVVDGECERCHGEVVRKKKSQWMLKITEYADKLLDGLDTVDFVDRVVTAERNWIGRSYGAEVCFATSAGDGLRVFTTRPDTLFGATYMVIAPEHEYIEKWKSLLTNYDEIADYRAEAAKKSDFERSELVKDKTGVLLRGVNAINPVNGENIPIFVSDYVLVTYGTGAIMAVPAHDSRDYEFAKKFGLEIREVVEGGDISESAYTDTNSGIMVNSGFLNGLCVEEAKEKITEFLTDNNLGERTVKYKLRDWVFARQRYWGEPIPLIWCEKCGWQPVPDNELPLRLPEVEVYEPTDNGESPLAAMTDWVNTTCPCCGGKAKRETDTMPQWAGSSWYFLRYCDPNADDTFASRESLDYWMPVDWYIGGMEHATLHLLYSRFWAIFLYDEGLISCPEPYLKRSAQGMILGEDNEKMSKSRGNVVNPDDVISEYGADTVRLYEMFMGDFEKTAPWSPNSVKGCKRFLDRYAALGDMLTDMTNDQTERELHKTIKKVTEDIEVLKFNTAIASMMEFVNFVYKAGGITPAQLKSLTLILCPFAPHIAEEVWEKLGGEGFCSLASWPEYDAQKCLTDTIEIAVQIGGKMKGTIVIPVDADQDTAFGEAMKNTAVSPAVEGKTIVKVIYVPGRIINIIVK